MARLDKLVTIITGGGQGLGAVASAKFAAEGSTVVIADINAEAAERTASEIVENGGQAAARAVDVTDEDAVRDLMDTTAAEFGSIDVLYNNSGISAADDGTSEETSLDTWKRTFAVNVEGVFLCCKYGIPHMQAQESGSIINVASFVAHVGSATPQVAYAASKGAVLSYTREIAAIHAREGIRANALCPGPVLTPLLAQYMANEEARHRRIVHIPMGRFGEAEEIVNGAMFLAGPESSFMTGQSLLIDGGITSAYTTPL